MNVKTLMLAAGTVLLLTTTLTKAEENSPESLNDLEIAHVAYTADVIDIKYAHLALALSDNPKIREFANTMIRDHEAVNDQALALLQELELSPLDNYLSQALVEESQKIISEMKVLSGDAFDHYYATNELNYHKAVNELVENAFLPNIENARVKALFEQGLAIFKMHETHADKMVMSLNAVSMN